MGCCVFIFRIADQPRRIIFDEISAALRMICPFGCGLTPSHTGAGAQTRMLI